MKDNSKLLEKNKRKMSSIAGKLHRQLVLAKLGAFFAADIFLAAMLFLFWIIDAENAAGVNFRNILLRRRFSFLERNAGSFTYTVSENGTILLQKNASLLLAFVVIVISIALFFQLLKIIFPYYGEYRRIKKTLGPINEMALKADEISRLSFDESKFHTIENAIEHISPEQTRDLSLGDSDLQGIEAAINNMLHR
ncbi:MAG: sensor histidine kinase, partial [Lachnospiraceae bacterium]|nr:sensor histidine kinase [Lachnospiraceae bacterium]